MWDTKRATLFPSPPEDERRKQAHTVWATDVNYTLYLQWPSLLPMPCVEGVGKALRLCKLRWLC